MRYALRLIECCAPLTNTLHLIVSDAALRVLAEEEQIKLSANKLTSEALLGKAIPNLHVYSVKDIGAAVASGSFSFDGMVVVPCSMNTLAAIANGISSNLIHRAAEVALKEGRKLIMVPRETPLSAIHLDNMAKLARLNVCILPAMPGFYHRPATLEQLVDMLVMKIMDQMGLESALVARWGSKPSSLDKVAN